MSDQESRKAWSADSALARGLMGSSALVIRSLIVPVPVCSVKGAVCGASSRILTGALPGRPQTRRGALCASVIDRFRRVATAPDQERRFPIGPESADKLGYHLAEVDALLPFGHDSGY
jgi:hypothetical protein